MRTIPALAALLAFSAASPAQIGGSGALGPFVPDVDTTLDTTWNGGRFEFESIVIPSWVAVTFVGPNPAVLLSQGNVDIRGSIILDGQDGTPTLGGRGGPGGYTGGNPGTGICCTPGFPGSGPGAGQGGPYSGGARQGAFGGSAGHSQPGFGAGCGSSIGQEGRAYGSVDPLDFQGGSGGGGDSTTSCLKTMAGGGGGGALAILADGAVSISGRISADGGASNGAGSGGTIVVRALGGVDHTGSISVQGPGRAADGYIRLDSYSTRPTGSGTLVGVSKQLGVPNVETRGRPIMGQILTVRVVASVPGEGIALALSPRAALVPLGSWGTLKLDPQTMVIVGTGVADANEFDPQIEFSIPIPQDPMLLGLPLFWQGFVFQTPMPSPRLTNVFITSVQ